MMDIYDTQAARQVWKRVGLLPTEPSPEEGLQALLDREWELYRFYRAQGRRGHCWGELARQTCGRLRQLQAVHYLKTGCRMPCQKRATGPACLSPDSLRRAIELTRQAAQDYARLAGAGQHPTLFSAMAQQQERHGQYLLEQLAALL